MNSTKVQEIVQKLITNINQTFPLIFTVANELIQTYPNARVLVIGGAVRDVFLELTLKDIDLEVYGVELHQLEKILRKYGVVRKVGKVFGVLKLDGLPVDWALPRTDGPGRKPVVSCNPHLSFEQAFIRRDLTINAMGVDLISGQLIDPFDGLKDLEYATLRVPDADFFVQDPLRYFRVMQFAGRFCFAPDDQLLAIGKVIDLAAISRERIEEEFYKLCVLASKPSLGLEWLHKTNRLQEIMPEVYALIGVEQEYQWHPEGDVFEHTKQAIDAAALQQYACDEDRYAMVLAALCHDVGKVITSRMIEGRIRSLGHDVEGVAIVQILLKRITSTLRIIAKVLKLVRWHMTPYALVKNNAKSGAYKRLAVRLAPETSCKELALLARCDKSARNPEKNGPLLGIGAEESVLEDFIEKAKRYGVFECPEAPVLTGKDFQEIMQPGPAMGAMLKKAYELQIEQGISDKEQLKALITGRKE